MRVLAGLLSDVRECVGLGDSVIAIAFVVVTTLALAMIEMSLPLHSGRQRERSFARPTHKEPS